MKVVSILLILILSPSVVTATEETLPEEEGDPQVDDDRSEIDVNQKNGVDAFEGDIMMTAEQWDELKKEFERTGQPLPS